MLEKGEVLLANDWRQDRKVQQGLVIAEDAISGELIL